MIIEERIKAQGARLKEQRGFLIASMRRMLTLISLHLVSCALCLAAGGRHD